MKKSILLFILIFSVFNAFGNEGEKIKFRTLLSSPLAVNVAATIYREPEDNSEVYIFENNAQLIKYANKWNIQTLNLKKNESAIVALFDVGGAIGAQVFIENMKWMFPKSPVNNVFIDIGYIFRKCHCLVPPKGKKTTHVAIVAVNKKLITESKESFTFRVPTTKPISKKIL